MNLRVDEDESGLMLLRESHRAHRYSLGCPCRADCLLILPEIIAVEVFEALAAAFAAFAACLERLARRCARFRLAWTLFLGGRPRRRRDLMFSAEGEMKCLGVVLKNNL